MSETNEKGKGLINAFKQFFSIKDKNPGKRSSKDHDGKNDSQLSIPSAPRKKTKRIAPQPPMELSIETSTIYEPRRSQQKQNYAKSVNDIEKGFSELTLSDQNSNLKQVSLAQMHTESESTNSKEKKMIVKQAKSFKTKKGSNAVPEIKRIFNSNGNQNVIIENCQVQKSSENDNMKNSKSKNIVSKKSSKSIVSKSKPTKAETEQAVLNLQTDSKNDEPTFESNEQTNVIAENQSLQILENETYQIETKQCNIRNEDDANRSLKKEIENKNEGDIALEKIESVMQEVENFKLEIQKLNNSENFFAIEMGLTNAIIKLDGIQMPKNELLKKKRKEGIILIHELFKQLDEQGKANQT